MEEGEQSSLYGRIENVLWSGRMSFTFLSCRRFVRFAQVGCGLICFVRFASFCPFISCVAG